ncbi:dihydroorotase [Thermanaeromonas sp.]|uniref:dihydroorotase n=1 Tax=Thermanaeromonas sp. TaxID=2003697 RepID=UPI003D1622C4
MKILLRGGRVIDPSQDLDKVADVLVSGDRIAAIGENLEKDRETKVLDVGGCIVAPGFIDMHVHLREPGYEQKETIATGTRAAAAGGFTAVACMPNTQPVADNAAVIAYIRERARAVGVVRVYPIGALSKGSKGEELAEIYDLVEAGAVAISDDGNPVMNAEVMRRALEYTRLFNIPVISHCEDLNLTAGGVMHEGFVSTILGLRGIPAASEQVMVARDVILAGLTGGRLHLAHLSSAGSLHILKEAKSKGVKVTAEVTPHHLCLTDEAVIGYDTTTKVNPPLRSEEDRQALEEALRDGLLDVLATDHAPHTEEEKDVEYDIAPFGISGLETAIPLVVTRLVEKGRLSWQRLIEAWSCRPASILNIPGGSLKEGSIADITVIAPDWEKEVDVDTFYSLGKNSPFQGLKLKGWPLVTIVAGRLVMENGRVLY